MIKSCHFHVFVFVLVADPFPLLIIPILFYWGRLDAKCIQNSDKFLDVLK